VILLRSDSHERFADHNGSKVTRPRNFMVVLAPRLEPIDDVSYSKPWNSYLRVMR
jgi:hypothetical protein